MLNLQNYIRDKNQAIKVLVSMCIRLVSDENKPLLDVAQDPWKSLNKSKIKPSNPDLCDEVERRWKMYYAAAVHGKTGPHPKAWKMPKLTEWLNENPVMEDGDIDFLIKMVNQQKTLATNAGSSKK